MCGICGKLSWTGALDKRVVEGMNQSIAHRGPDAGEIYLDGPVALGHRRLAIIDLSPTGRQPMLDTRAEIVISFNGEIYNYQELRRELLDLGAQFRTTSDTEIILEAYRAWGVDCLKRLNGMFAFALWDKRSETLLLARDRLGKKPLYYYLAPDGSGVSFASEIKALAEDPQVPSKINDRAVMHYLTLGYILTSECILAGVQKLPPGHFMTMSRGGASRPTQYWDLAEHFHNKAHYRSDAEAAEHLRVLLDDAVKIRLMSDVPLGAFLSGGIDSSSIVASMCQARAANQNLTFTAGFREKSFNELDEAALVAKYLGVSHREQFIESTVASELSRIVYYCDEPFADTSMIPMYFLSKFTREHVTVALSGDGADEIFGGYETYLADIFHHYTRFIPKSLIDVARVAYTSLRRRDFGKVSTDYKIIHFLKAHSASAGRAHFGWRCLFDRTEMRSMVRPEYHALLSEADPYHDFERFGRDVQGCHYLDQASYVDIKTWLVDDILVKADRTTMAHSLEGRAPFLDYRLVEFAASLPVNMKIKRLQKKYLLKQSQQNRLPASTLSRKKAGFNAPIADWLSNSLRAFSAEARNDELVSRYIQPSFIANLERDHLLRRSDNSHKLFMLINLHLWSAGKQNALQKAA